MPRRSSSVSSPPRPRSIRPRPRRPSMPATPTTTGALAERPDTNPRHGPERPAQRTAKARAVRSSPRPETLRGARQREPDVGAGLGVGGAGFATMGVRDRLDQGEAEAGAAGSRARGAAEALEGVWQVVVGEAGAVVDDVDLDPGVGGPCADLDRLSAVAACVVDQVGD